MPISWSISHTVQHEFAIARSQPIALRNDEQLARAIPTSKLAFAIPSLLPAQRLNHFGHAVSKQRGRLHRLAHGTARAIPGPESAQTREAKQQLDQHAPLPDPVHAAHHADTAD